MGMKSIIVLGIMALVLGSLAGALAGFPLPGAVAGSPPQPATGGEFSAQAVEEVADSFSASYTSVVEDLVSFLRDPDSQRAEQRREVMVDYARSLIPHFQGLAQQMEGELDGLTTEAQGTTSP